jgi:elongation factor G
MQCGSPTGRIIRKLSTATVQHREVFKKQTGGRGKFADIQVEVIGPADEGVEGLQFIDEIKGGNIPREYIPSVQKGFTRCHVQWCFGRISR